MGPRVSLQYDLERGSNRIKGNAVRNAVKTDLWTLLCVLIQSEIKSGQID